jgi:polar amino acid transport system ATP-binding protein
LISFEHVFKSYGSHQVLIDVSERIEPGEKVVIIGASGSGKTTLIRCINGLTAVDQGQVFVEDVAVHSASTSLSAIRRKVGFVFQHFNLFPHMTALQNITFAPTELKLMPRVEAERVGMQLLERVGMADRAGAVPGQLSGGQKQRVAIARALAMDPELLLFDEPTSALDPELVGEVLGVIRGLAEEGRTMLLVTHELGFAYHVATRVIFLADGTIHEQGTPDEVLKHPRRERTQVFLARHKEFSL